MLGGENIAITIIIVCCWILYKSGKAAALLEVFRLSPDTAPAEIETTPPEFFRDPTPDRLKLEAVAMNILLYNGVDTAPIRVKRLTDAELNNIINLFMDDLL